MVSLAWLHCGCPGYLLLPIVAQQPAIDWHGRLMDMKREIRPVRVGGGVGDRERVTGLRPDLQAKNRFDFSGRLFVNPSVTVCKQHPDRPSSTGKPNRPGQVSLSPPRG